MTVTRKVTIHTTMFKNILRYFLESYITWNYEKQSECYSNKLCIGFKFHTVKATQTLSYRAVKRIHIF